VKKRSHVYAIYLLMDGWYVCNLSFTSNFAAGMSVSSYERKPSAALQPYVDCYWMVSFDGAAGETSAPQSCLPVGMVEVIIQLDNNACEVWADGQWQALPSIFLAGMYQERVLWRASGNTRKFGIRLKPETLSCLFCVLPAALFNNYTGLHNVAGSAYGCLAEQLSEAKSMAAMVAHAEVFLLAQIGRQQQEQHYVVAAARLIRSTKGNMSIDEVCKAVYVSPRQLQRSFRSTLGTGPKNYMRIIRFRNAFVQMQHLQQHGGWSGLSYELGYADQAHFIKDFKAFAGIVPSLVQQHLPAEMYGRYAIA
jgi:AraC-like DNA-binding protein